MVMITRQALPRRSAPAERSLAEPGAIDAFDAAAEGMVHLCLHGIFPACFIAGILILISQMLRVFYYLAC